MIKIIIEIALLLFYTTTTIYFITVMPKKIKKARRSAVEAKLMCKGMKNLMLEYCGRIDELINAYNNEAFRNIISQNDYLSKHYEKYESYEEEA
jgi:hypothetical protein